MYSLDWLGMVSVCPLFRAWKLDPQCGDMERDGPFKGWGLMGSGWVMGVVTLEGIGVVPVEPWLVLTKA